MRTLPVGDKNIKAFYSTLRDEPGVLTRVHGELLFFSDAGDIHTIEPEDCVWLCVLGECAVADVQALADARHGGFAKIACTRLQEVA